LRKCGRAAWSRVVESQPKRGGLGKCPMKSLAPPLARRKTILKVWKLLLASIL